jgi:hypothetical protein
MHALLLFIIVGGLCFSNPPAHSSFGLHRPVTALASTTPWSQISIVLTSRWVLSFVFAAAAAALLLRYWPYHPIASKNPFLTRLSKGDPALLYLEKSEEPIHGYSFGANTSVAGEVGTNAEKSL